MKRLVEKISDILFEKIFIWFVTVSSFIGGVLVLLIAVLPGPPPGATPRDRLIARTVGSILTGLGLVAFSYRNDKGIPRYEWKGIGSEQAVFLFPIGIFLITVSLWEGQSPRL